MALEALVQKPKPADNVALKLKPSMVGKLDKLEGRGQTD
jgi:hypothetical protein